MDSNRDDTPRADVQLEPVGTPHASVPPDQRTARRVALDHLAESLRAAYRDTPIVTWQQIAQCTLRAAQQGAAASASASDTLQQRMVLNHDLDHAFMARKNRQPWKTYDGPTLLIAAEDLIAAEQTHSTPLSPGR